MVTSTVIVLSPCAICQDEDNGTDMVVTTCGHNFHSQCMKDWENTAINNQRVPKCPYCNVNYPTSSGYYDNNYGYSSSRNKNHFRIHALSSRRVLVLEDGQPSPEEELKTARTNLDSVQVLLNTETDKVRQLTSELATLRGTNEALQSNVTQLKSESKAQAHKISSILGELKAEKQNRGKTLAIHLGEKDRLQKRIDDGSAFIDKMKAERNIINGNLHALRVDNTRIRSAHDKQTQIMKQLQVQTINLEREKSAMQLTINNFQREKHAMQLKINSMNGSANLLSSNYIPRNLLDDLTGGFQKLEAEYLALKGLFNQKLQESTKPDLQLNSYHDLAINPVLLQQSHDSHSLPVNPVLMNSFGKELYLNEQHSSNGQHPLTEQHSLSKQHSINVLSVNGLQNGQHATNPPSITPVEDVSGRSKRNKNKGKQRVSFDPTRKTAEGEKVTQDPSVITGGSGSSKANLAQNRKSQTDLSISIENPKITTASNHKSQANENMTKKQKIPTNHKSSVGASKENSIVISGDGDLPSGQNSANKVQDSIANVSPIVIPGAGNLTSVESSTNKIQDSIANGSTSARPLENQSFAKDKEKIEPVAVSNEVAEHKQYMAAFVEPDPTSDFYLDTLFD